jgi:hypothetical protein
MEALEGTTVTIQLPSTKRLSAVLCNTKTYVMKRSSSVFRLTDVNQSSSANAWPVRSCVATFVDVLFLASGPGTVV